MQWFKPPRSFSRRLILSHMMVALLTTFIGMTAYAIIAGSSFTATGDRFLAMVTSIFWMFDMDDTDIAGFNLTPGSTTVIDQAGIVQHVVGLGGCTVGDRLATCAPKLAEMAQQEGTFTTKIEGRTMRTVIIDTVTGHRLVSQREPLSTTMLFLSLLFPVFLLMIIAIPVALVLVRLTVGPLTRRLDAITSANRAFAGGNFSVRVSDPRDDDVGQLAQQFNSMADALEQNVHVLRDLAQRNSDLAEQAEAAAVQMERVRLSRDLHDSIAQSLFSLSMNAATLPQVIVKDSNQGIEQAERIAQLAEKAQLDLRKIIVDLRPGGRNHRSLNEALEALCKEWSAINNIPATCDMVVQGQNIPPGVRDAVLSIAQEALNNIAKHAHAKEATVSLLHYHTRLVLSISDDGIGFEPVKEIPEGHFGLVGMRERAATVAGTLEIESSKSRGSTILLTVPLLAEEES